MCSSVRIALVVMVLMLVPLVAHAGNGPCPDDLVAAKTCARESPPYYVVSNRSLERLGPQFGTGCQPWILKNPDCTMCDGDSDACFAAAVDVEQVICGFEMPQAGAQEGDVLYEMCCNCPSDDPEGTWMYRERTLRLNPDTGAWECPDPGPWQKGLPPETGIKLPPPTIASGLAIAGVGLLFAGLWVRRRSLRAT